jgi:hypothetical protein
MFFHSFSFLLFPLLSIRSSRTFSHFLFSSFFPHFLSFSLFLWFPIFRFFLSPSCIIHSVSHFPPSLLLSFRLSLLFHHLHRFITLSLRSSSSIFLRPFFLPNFLSSSLSLIHPSSLSFSSYSFLTFLLTPFSSFFFLKLIP